MSWFIQNRCSTAGNAVTTNDKPVRVHQYQIMQKKALNLLDQKCPPERNDTVSKEFLKNWLFACKEQRKSTKVSDWDGHKTQMFAFCFFVVFIVVFFKHSL